jgi:hypothetical protein
MKRGCGMMIELVCIAAAAVIIWWFIRKNEKHRENQQWRMMDRWASYYAVPRQYYGDDKKTKPNRHCRWVKCNEPPGWYENDYRLRARITNSIKSPFKV